MKKMMMFTLIGALGFSTAMAQSAIKTEETTSAKIVREEVSLLSSEQVKNFTSTNDGFYLRNLESMANTGGPDDPKKDTGFNELLDNTKINLKKQGDDAYDLMQYKFLTKLFIKLYEIHPSQATSGQYTEFYKLLSEALPNTNVLATIAIWHTDSIYGIVPTLHMLSSYWDDPARAARTYDIMALVDPVGAKKTLEDAILDENAENGFGRGEYGDDKEATLEEHFSFWESQNNDTPSCQDAKQLKNDCLQELAQRKLKEEEE